MFFMLSKFEINVNIYNLIHLLGYIFYFITLLPKMSQNNINVNILYLNIRFILRRTNLNKIG